VTPSKSIPGILTSAALAHVPHAFTTRLGGVSSGPFASLNFGNPGDLAVPHRDPIANIRANYGLVLGAIGCEGRELIEVHQVHGGVVHEVCACRPAHPTASDTRADALVTDDPTRALAVRIADCAPVLIASADGRIVAAVHAGWRGVVAGVVTESVRRMRLLSPEARTSGLAAAVGPCISAANFEVGPEVAAEFRRVFGADTPHVRAGSGDRFHADLKAALAEQLRHLGVATIDVLPHCTYADPSLFFSHRRATHEGIVVGRHAAVIAPCAD
jgi:YfiH family protein